MKHGFDPRDFEGEPPAPPEVNYQTDSSMCDCGHPRQKHYLGEGTCEYRTCSCETFVPEGTPRPEPEPASGVSLEELLASVEVPAGENEAKDGSPSPARAEIRPARGLLAGKMAAAREEEKKRAEQPGAHVIVKAGAGCGKTSTGCEGLKVKFGLEPSITPSVEQQAIWDAIKETTGRTCCVTAFGKDIADELRRHIQKINGKEAWRAGTTHSFGFWSCRKALGDGIQLDDNRTKKIIAEVTGTEIRQLREARPGLIAATCEIVDLCKQTLSETTPEALADLCSHFEVEIDSDQPVNEIFDLVSIVMEKSREVHGTIEYSDMVWLPVILDLPIFKNDLMIVDEAQDTNRCRQEFCKRGTHRLMLVGDENQAIMGFAGADSEAMSRMLADLSATPRGCRVLPLTETRRCGRAIVEEANKLVPALRAHKDNCDGKVSKALYTGYREDDGSGYGRWIERKPEQTYLPLVGPNDLLITRTTAHCAMQYFKLMRMNKPVCMLGKRDLGAKIIKTLAKMKAETVPELVGHLSDWYEMEVAKETAKQYPSEVRLINLRDRYECVLFFTEGARTVREVFDRVDAAFTIRPGMARIGTLHRSKGLEARRVFFLQPDGAGCPHPMARSDWQMQQERNLLYVGITRAIEELIWVR